jgi:gluconate 2-dehydrogenase alpha chain
VEDWPFGLEELEPYYDKVEYEIGISGQAGNINGTIDPRGNIFEGPRQRAYPMPPLRGTEFTERMAAAAKRLGWHPFPGPAAINSVVYDDRPGCVYHGYCSRGGCHINAKNSTAVSTLPKAMATNRLKVVPYAHVTTVAVDERTGRVTGVHYVSGGEEYFQPADVVLLASYTYENVRLLLLSKSKPFPNGLSNNAGQVGKHYMTHNTASTLAALFPFDLNNWYGLPAQGVAVDNWADGQLRSRRPRLHRRRQSLGLLRPAANRSSEHEHIRQSADLGLGVEGVHQAERRPLEHCLHPEDHITL